MEIPKDLKVLIDKAAELTKEYVAVRDKIDAHIEGMSLSYEVQMALHSGIFEYVDYGQFCIADGIGLDTMTVENLVEFRKAVPFKKVLCPVCKRNVLPFSSVDHERM